MFDVDVDGVAYRESEVEDAGDEVVVADCGPARVGMAVCYDLRFPELFRALLDRGATVFTLPSAFTVPTGRDHWEVLVRARAIENQAFVLAAGQVGRAEPEVRLVGPLDDRRPLGTGARTGRRGRRGLCRVPTSTSSSRPGSGASCRSWGTADRSCSRRSAGQAPGTRGGRPDGTRGSGRAAATDPRRRGPRIRPAGIPLDPGRRHRRRGRRRIRAGLPLLRFEGERARRAVQAALVTADRGDRGGRRRHALAPGEARERGRLHHRLVPLRPGTDEGDHRRGDPRRQLLRPDPPRTDQRGLPR